MAVAGVNTRICKKGGVGAHSVDIGLVKGRVVAQGLAPGRWSNTGVAAS